MEQPAESIPPHNPPARQEAHLLARAKRRRLPQRAMQPVAVVVLDILTQHPHQVPASTTGIRSKHSRRTVPTHRSAWAFARRPHRRDEHLHRLSGNDRVERALAAPIADHKPQPADVVSSPISRFQACWATHAPTGCAVTSST
jgi:hypothetical protein